MAWLCSFVLVLSTLAPSANGFSQPSGFHSQVVTPTRVAHRAASYLTAAISPLGDDDNNNASPVNTPATPVNTAIVDIDSNSKGIDDVRLARSLVRRDRLARWRAAAVVEEDELRDRQDIYFELFAILPVIIAFLSWEKVSFGLSEFLDMYGAVKANDGGAFANNLLRPTITGVVVPVISIALATLVSTTVNVLRQRQVDLRSLVNKEACELRLLRRAVFGMFGTRQHAGRRSRALALMYGYSGQLVKECHPGAVEMLEDMQLSGGIAANELDRLSAMLHGVDGAAASRQGSVEVADDMIYQLDVHRSERVALLLSVFPLIHWGVLIGGGLSICSSFLLTSNQQTLQYLNSIQLRFLFATIVGVCSSTATLCWDLSDPFSGTFSMEGASTQLEDLRVCLREDVRDALSEEGEMASSTRDFFRYVLGGPDASVANTSANRSGEGAKNNPSPRYGLFSTLYFHLLTGPVGSQVRAIGDILAWGTAIVKRRVVAIAKWQQWRWQR